MELRTALFVGLATAAAATVGAPAAASTSPPRLLSEAADPLSGLLCPPALGFVFLLPPGAVSNNAGCYNMSAVTITHRMFQNSGSFNEPITWDTPYVTSLFCMFYLAASFNQPLPWDTSSVADMGDMFREASAFNQPVAWDTSSVTKMNGMFAQATSFNQPLQWDTSSVTIMSVMFYQANAFAQELEHWDVGAVTNFGNMFWMSRMSAEAVPGGPGVGRACRIHHSWQAQNGYWDPVGAQLVADAGELDLSICAPHLVRPPPSAPPAPSPPPASPPPPGGASSTGDPHLVLAHGGRADFRGCEGCYFNRLSTQDVLINARTSLATFELKGSTVHGYFLTEVHLAWHDAPAQRWLNASVWAAEVGDHNFGWRAVNSTCGADPDERAKPMYYNTRRACGAANMSRGYASLEVELPKWRVSVTSQPVYGRLEGPRHRLDLSLAPRVPEAELSVWPHGLIGQSFDGDGAPLSGRVDDYSAAGGVVHTSAMAEGAIEGTADDYRVPTAFSAAFRYSRLGALPGQTRPRDAAAIALRAGASVGAPAPARLRLGGPVHLGAGVTA